MRSSDDERGDLRRRPALQQPRDFHHLHHDGHWLLLLRKSLQRLLKHARNRKERRNQKKVLLNERERFELAKQFCVERNVPLELRKRIKDYYSDFQEGYIESSYAL